MILAISLDLQKSPWNQYVVLNQKEKIIYQVEFF